MDSNCSHNSVSSDKTSNNNALLFDSSSESILDSREMLEFIAQHANENVADLKLKFSARPLPFDLSFALVQIEARRKNRQKLSRFLNHSGFLFPSDLAAQQATDQIVANYHSTLISMPSRWLDLTAGLGIDALCATLKGHEVTAIEIESWKCDVLRHNVDEILSEGPVSDMQIYCNDATQFIEDCEPDEYDVIFIDPARRGGNDKRLYALSDCMPNVISLLPRLLRVAPTVIIKSSPMLEVGEVMRQLPSISEIKAVSLKGECKEILIICRRDFEGPIKLEAVLLDSTSASEQTQIKRFSWNSDLLNRRTDIKNNEETASISFEPSRFHWIYEPDAALLKLHANAALLSKWPEVSKADKHTEIYLSDKLIEDFPGRITEISKWVSSGDLKKLKGAGLSVVSRNYPEKADAIRKKYGFKENPSTFLYAFRLNGKPVTVLSQLIHKNNQSNSIKNMNTLMTTDFDFKDQKSVYHGKVRDVYDIADRLLVMVATDRISAFDVILPKGIPFKGQVLNQIASYFLDATSDIVPNWKVCTPDPMVTIGLKCEPMKVEMIVRGYLAGSAWREYAAGKREICGVKLPDGLRENQKLPHPILTPTTKADEGHDENISREEIIERGIVSKEDYEQVEKYALALFERGTEMAARQGLILVDTKYEFGKHDGNVILIDEIHTPDSSRYFYADGYQERFEKGEEQRQLSKEFVRRWLIDNGFMGKDGQKVPEMTDEYCREVSDRYIELFEHITGKKFEKAETENLSDRIAHNVAEALKTL